MSDSGFRVPGCPGCGGLKISRVVDGKYQCSSCGWEGYEEWMDGLHKALFEGEFPVPIRHYGSFTYDSQGFIYDEPLP